jgi:N5-(cytidine 5'-diphosphoramidyl)-L-glutamine hydrolase
MKLVGISLRVTVVPEYGERRDALDQRWIAFLQACGLTPVLIPNHPKAAETLMTDLPLVGVVLTGGNNLHAYGGDAPERDATEQLILRTASKKRLPVLGVCRGMQVIQDFFGVRLERVEGHVTPKQQISVRGKEVTKNSYHNFGSRETVAALQVWAKATDGVVKAISHVDLPITAVMWHPERQAPFDDSDIEMTSRHFKQGK